MNRHEIQFEQMNRVRINRANKARKELEEALEAEHRDESLINELESFLDADMCGEF